MLRCLVILNIIFLIQSLQIPSRLEAIRHARSVQQPSHYLFKAYAKKEERIKPSSAESMVTSRTTPPTAVTKIFTMPEELSVATSRLLLLAISAAYGTNYAAVKTLSDELDPSLASLLRFGLSSVVFLPSVLKYGSKVPYLMESALLIGFSNFLGYYGQALALNEGLQGSAVAFICSLAVVVVPTLDAIFVRDDTDGENETMDKKMLAFLPSLISALGVGFLTGFGSGGSTSESIDVASTGPPLYAYMAAFIQPFLFGWAYWRQPVLLRKTCSEPGHYLAFTGTSLIAVTLGAMIWACTATSGSDGIGATSRFFEHATEEPVAILAVLWTGLATTAGTSLLENLAMKQLTGTESTIIYSTEPLFATFFGFLLLGEGVGWSTAVGGALILSAILLSTKLDA